MYWKLLRKQLDNVKDGGVIVMIAPPNPYRCPPGPYERVSMRAHQLKSTGRQYGNQQVLFWDKQGGRVEAASDPRGIGTAVVTPVVPQ